MRFWMCLMAVAVLMSRVAVGQQYRAGDEVVVIQKADVRVPEGKVDYVLPGLTLEVEATNGKFIWVENGSAPGWLDAGNVIPLDQQAIEPLTRMIQSNQKSSSLYGARGNVWRKLKHFDEAISDY